VPSKRVIYGVQPAEANFDRPPNAPGLSATIDGDGMTSDDRHLLTADGEAPKQSCGRPLPPGQDKLGQLGL